MKKLRMKTLSVSAGPQVIAFVGRRSTMLTRSPPQRTYSRSVTGCTVRRLKQCDCEGLHCSAQQHSIWRPGFFSRCSSSLEPAAGWRPEDRIVLDRPVRTGNGHYPPGHYPPTLGHNPPRLYVSVCICQSGVGDSKYVVSTDPLITVHVIRRMQ